MASGRYAEVLARYRAFVTAFQASYGIGLLVVGRLLDRFGQRVRYVMVKNHLRGDDRDARGQQGLDQDPCDARIDLESGPVRGHLSGKVRTARG